MSSTKGFSFIAGAARLTGLVPRTAVLPNVGTTSGAALVVLIQGGTGLSSFVTGLIAFGAVSFGWFAVAEVRAMRSL